MKRTLACDWCILILVCLACRKTLKEDVKKWMSKDWCYASNTESKFKPQCLPTEMCQTIMLPFLSEQAREEVLVDLKSTRETCAC